MPEVVYYVAVSLDGYIATPDGGVEWLAPFEGSNEDYGYEEFYDSVDAVLLGRRTFEQALTFGGWPYVGKPALVFSHAESGSPRDGVVITGESPEAVLEKLDAEGTRRAWLVGGGTLAGAFESAGLIDEYVVSIMPVILGGGVALFEGRIPTSRLTLLGAVSHPDGVLQARYRAVRLGRFSATIGRVGVNPYVDLPEAVSALFSTRGYVPVVATIDGHAFRSGIVPLGSGRHRLFVNGRMRSAAGVDVGDTVEVTLERDFAPRTRAVPEPLARALAADDEALRAWRSLRQSRRSEILDYLNSLKRADTLARNVAKVIDSLRRSC